MWALLRLPRFGGANHANGHDNRSRHRQIGLSRCTALMLRASWSIRRQLKRRYVLAFFREVTAMPDWHRGLRVIALLVTRAPGTGSHCTIDATGLREALRQAAEE